MHSETDEKVTVRRDCEVTLIPFGNKVTLKKGEEGRITQALGGSYTLMIRGNLVRVESQDADAIGKIPEIQPWIKEQSQDGRANENALWEAMKTCYDPEIPINIVDLGLIYSCQVDDYEDGGSQVLVKMTLTAPGCGMGDILANEVLRKLEATPGVAEARVELVWDPPWDRSMIAPEAQLQMGLM